MEFSNLSEDHKAEFLQFLIKNNICFQEGKENCTAKIAIKGSNPPPSQKHKPSRMPANKFIVNPNQKEKGRERKSNLTTMRTSIRPLKDLTNKN